ncbi:MAG: hypothetical protein ACPIOQ_58130, partial [Promethearchaeia archaeon]
TPLVLKPKQAPLFSEATPGQPFASTSSVWRPSYLLMDLPPAAAIALGPGRVVLLENSGRTVASQPSESTSETFPGKLKVD